MQQNANGSRFPWYDGYWLERFVRAKAYIAEHRPDVLPNFLAAMEPFRTDPAFSVAMLRNVLDDATLAHVRSVIAGLKPNQLELHEIKTFGRWVVHNHPILVELQARMTALAEQAAGEPLEPSYNFLSMYTRMGRCPLHQDAPWAKWTLDLCIDQSEPWPIHFSQVRPWPEDETFPADGWEQQVRTDPANRFESQTLMPGDAALFSGSSQWHYRDPIPAQGAKNFCHLLFFHFTPRGMRTRLDAADWEARFDVPGLSQALGNPVSEVAAMNRSLAEKHAVPVSGKDAA